MTNLVNFGQIVNSGQIVNLVKLSFCVFVNLVKLSSSLFQLIQCCYGAQKGYRLIWAGSNKTRAPFPDCLCSTIHHDQYLYHVESSMAV